MLEGARRTKELELGMCHWLSVLDLEFQQMQGANQVGHLKQLVVPRLYTLRKFDGTRDG